MPSTTDFLNSGNFTVPDDLYSMTIYAYGGGGGGEHIANNGTVCAGTNGGNSSFLGIVAGGGRGGGRNANGSTTKNAQGVGGAASDSANWQFYGATVSLANGNDGQVPSASVNSPKGGTGASIGSFSGGNGGNGSNNQVTFYDNMYHVFNDTSNVTLVQSSSPDVNINVENQTVEGGNPCGTFFFNKRYRINFNYPYDNANYNFTMNGFCQQAGGGSTSGPFYYAGFTDKSSSSIRVYFCRQSSNTFIRCFNFTTSGTKASHRGSGGGGGAAAYAFIDRATFLAQQTYSLGNSYAVSVGTAGAKGSAAPNPFGQNVQYSRATDGGAGRVQIYMIFEARADIKANGVDGPISVLKGTQINLQWTISGDADNGTYLTQDGTQIGQVNNSGSQLVTPTTSTVYGVNTSGLGGSASDSVTVIVYQPPEASASFPSEVEYGEAFDVTVTTRYTNVSVVLQFELVYEDGRLENQTFDLTNNVSDDAANGPALEFTYQPAVNWDLFGPITINATVVANGDGGEITTNPVEISVNIDRLPDLLNIPERLELLPAEDPVVSPDEDTVISDPIQITGINIPIKIKAGKPIQVRFDEDDPTIESNWKSVEQL
jgi:hypothetical protein